MPPHTIIEHFHIGDKGSVIDSLTEVPFILGSDEGMKIVKKVGAEAIIVDDTGKVYMTDGVKNLLDHAAQ